MTQGRPHRWRRFAKRLTLALCVVILLAWAFSTLWYAYTSYTVLKEKSEIGQRWDIKLGSGNLNFGFTYCYPLIPDAAAAEPEASSNDLFSMVNFTPWPSRDCGRLPAFDMGWHLPSYRVVPSLPADGWSLTIPIWCVFLPFALTLRYLVYLERRPGPGHCAICNYDLRGANHERCPECGTTVSNGYNPETPRADRAPTCE